MDFEKENIDEELLGKPNEGFNVPDGYFAQLNEDIIRKTSGNGFTIPVGYFETLETRILKKVDKPKIIRHDFAFKQLILGIAASIIIIAGFFTVKNKFYSSHQYSESKMNNLSDEEIINYVDVDDIKDLHIAENTSNKVEDKTQKQEEDYLINNADEQQIIEQL